jgi:hypothetical protein
MDEAKQENIPVRLKARFLCDDSLYSGMVTNLSDRGMCINTTMRILFNPSDKLLITLKEKNLNVSAKIKRIIMEDSISDSMDVEVLEPSEEYLEFVDSFRPAV